MSRHHFFVDKETSYFPDGKKNEVYSIDCDGEFMVAAVSRDEVEELIQVLNYSISDSLINKVEDKNGE